MFPIRLLVVADRDFNNFKLMSDTLRHIFADVLVHCDVELLFDDSSIKESVLFWAESKGVAFKYITSSPNCTHVLVFTNNATDNEYVEYAKHRQVLLKTVTY